MVVFTRPSRQISTSTVLHAIKFIYLWPLYRHKHFTNLRTIYLKFIITFMQRSNKFCTITLRYPTITSFFIYDSCVHMYIKNRQYPFELSTIPQMLFYPLQLSDQNSRRIKFFTDTNFLTHLICETTYNRNVTIYSSQHR